MQPQGRPPRQASVLAGLLTEGPALRALKAVGPAEAPVIQELVRAPWVVLVVQFQPITFLSVRLQCGRCRASVGLESAAQSPRLEVEAFSVLERVRMFHRQHQLCRE